MKIRKFLKRYMYFFFAILVLFIGVVPVSAAGTSTDADASIILSQAPDYSDLYVNFANAFDYFTLLNSTQVSSNYLFSLTADPNVNNSNYLKKTRILNTFNNEDQVFFEEDFYYSFEIVYRMRCDDTAGNTQYYDLSDSVFILFNDTSIWEDTNPITADAIDDVSCKFLPAEVEVVNNLYYKLTFNFKIDPGSDLAKTNRVNYGSIGGYDMYGYLYQQWGILTPELNLFPVMDTNLTNPVTYSTHLRADLISMDCTKYSTDDYWSAYFDGLIGGLSDTIESQTDRIISGDDLTPPDLSAYQSQERAIESIADSVMLDLNIVDLNIEDSFSTVSSIISPGTTWLGSWLQQYQVSNALIHCLMFITIGFSTLLFAFRVLY